MSGVFINYRREDSGGHAGRLYDRLRQRYGPDRVFRDIDAIAPGVDYAQRIEAAIGTCDAVVVLIGREWLDVRGPDGQRRLDDPGDVLRREIAAALARSILVIPVLVEGATMPSEQKLPSDIALLARRNALELSDTRWDYDIGRLQQALDQVMVNHPSQAMAPAALAPARTLFGVRPARLTLLALFGALLLAGLALFALFASRAFQQASRGLDRTIPTFTIPSGAFEQPGREVNITITPRSGPSGTMVAVSGSGFRPHETIDLRVDTSRVKEITADSNGAFSGVRIPVRNPLGETSASDLEVSISAVGRSSSKHDVEPFQIRR